MNKKRFEHLDLIRSLAILVIIVIHVLSYHSKDKLIFLIWNYLHFVVVALVFSSGYILFGLYKNKLNSFREILFWYKKRFIRLILPFYYYLIAHYALRYLFPGYFSGPGLKKDISFIIQSVSFTGGIDLNWLPLLFLQLTLLFPFIIFSLRHKILLAIIILLSAGSGVLIFFKGFPYPHYRSIMWLPWMTVTYLGIYIYLKESRENGLIKQVLRHLFIGCLSGLGLLIFLKFLPQNKALVLTEHKYPPDSLYLLYGTAVTFLFLGLSRVKLHYPAIFNKIILYISERSYQLFFIHYLAIDFVFKITAANIRWSKPSVRVFLVIVLSLLITLFIQAIIISSRRFIIYQRKK